MPVLSDICLIAWDFYCFVDFGLTQCGLNFIYRELTLILDEAIEDDFSLVEDGMPSGLIKGSYRGGGRFASGAVFHMPSDHSSQVS